MQCYESGIKKKSIKIGTRLVLGECFLFYLLERGGDRSFQEPDLVVTALEWSVDSAKVLNDFPELS
jgi:hypothetical protein